MRMRWRALLTLLPGLLLPAFFLLAVAGATAQSGSGTVSGTVLDGTQAVVPGASVTLSNSVSGFSRTVTSDENGAFTINNVPRNSYQLVVAMAGFSPVTRRVDVNSSVGVQVPVKLLVASAGEQVTVEADTGELTENSSVFHTDIDRALFTKLPLESQSSGVSSLLTLATPGVAADSNGLFHGIGDHAENAFYVDGQPVTDQQSKVFSNQIPTSAIQSLEVISGAPPAEFGEKTSLVANIVTRSGQGVRTPHGQLSAGYGSFGSSTLSGDLSAGTQRFGNFVAVDLLNTGRFLDPGEFTVMHAKGNSETLFDRVDFTPAAEDNLHLNFEYTRSWFQTPNSYDTQNVVDGFGNPVGNADQRAKIGTLNVAPSYTHTLNDRSNVQVGLWARRDRFNYYPSRNPLADLGPIQQETVTQDRDLTNAGVRSDYNYVHGIHNIKAGGVYQQTLLNERFGLGIVDSNLNAPCLDANGSPVAGFNDPSQCAGAGYLPNDSTNPQATNPYNPVLACLDLTRPMPSANAGCVGTASALYRFQGHTDVKLASMYVQDALTLGRLSLNLGIRGDLYDGLSVRREAEPRAGVSYALARMGTVLRASYARTMETPFNENLVLSVKGCDSTVISALVPCVPANFNPGFRNEFHAGFEQTFGKRFLVNADYLWKYTHSGFDFSVLGATPVTFPIAWHNSKIAGFALRGALTDYHGLTAFVVMSSVSARFFPPQIGGLGATNTSGQPFRIDHDERFNQTTNVQYQWRRGPYLSTNWRYDSGLVAGAVPYATDASTPVDLTGLTADQQLQAGLMCGNVSPTLGQPLTSCAPALYHSDRVQIPAPGTENDDHNPPRIAPRNLFDLSLGDDDLLRRGADHKTLSARLTVVNLTNKVALYNFLSTFSGTHFVTPRSITGEIGFHF